MAMRSDLVELGLSAVAVGLGIIKGVTVVADLNNSGNVFVGSAPNQPVEMQPGDSLDMKPDTLQEVYAKAATAGDQVALIIYE